MAVPGEQDEYNSADPIGAANSTNRDEPVATESEREYEEEKIEVEEEKYGQTTGRSEQKPATAEALKSIATNTSAATGRTESHVEPKKPWYRRANPLKWGTTPPPPETRAPSREYTAGFLSLLTFQWMAPLMSVSFEHSRMTMRSHKTRLTLL